MNAIEKYQLKQALTGELVKSAGIAQWSGSARQRMAENDDLTADEIRRKGLVRGGMKALYDRDLNEARKKAGVPALLFRTKDQDRMAGVVRAERARRAGESKGGDQGGRLAKFVASRMGVRAEAERLKGQRVREKGFIRAGAGSVRDVGAALRGVVKGELPAHRMTTSANERARDWWKKRRESEK